MFTECLTDIQVWATVIVARHTATDWVRVSMITEVQHDVWYWCLMSCHWQCSGSVWQKYKYGWGSLLQDTLKQTGLGSVQPLWNDMMSDTGVWCPATDNVQGVSDRYTHMGDGHCCKAHYNRLGEYNHCGTTYLILMSDVLSLTMFRKHLTDIQVWVTVTVARHTTTDWQDTRSNADDENAELVALLSSCLALLLYCHS